MFSWKTTLNFKFKAFCNVIIGILRRSYNFDDFQCRRPEFGNMIYFDMFSSKNVISFQFQSLYDVIMGSLRININRE